MNNAMEVGLNVDFGPVLDMISGILSEFMFSWFGLLVGLYVALWWYEHLTKRVFFTASKEELADLKRERRHEEKRRKYLMDLTPEEREMRYIRKANRDMNAWADLHGYSRSQVRRNDSLKAQFLEDFYNEDRF